MKDEVKIIGYKTVLRGQFLRMDILFIEESCAGIITAKQREMAVRYHRVVCILPITVEGKLVLIRQPRIYYNSNLQPEYRMTVEFPAGKVGDIEIEADESLEWAAERELREETGYIAHGLRFLFKESVSAGCLSEERYCFYAPNVTLGTKEEDEESEQIEVLLLDIGEIGEFLKTETARGVEIDSGVRSMLFAFMFENQEENTHELTIPRQQNERLLEC